MVEFLRESLPCGEEVNVCQCGGCLYNLKYENLNIIIEVNNPFTLCKLADGDICFQSIVSVCRLSECFFIYCL
jgi:hypothetical protein